MSTKVLTDLDLDNNDLLNVGSGGGGGVATEDEGVSVDPAATTLNFVGAGVTATDAGSNVTTVTIPGGGGASPLTTKGDLYTYDTADQRLPVGSDGQILSANSATATGLEWIVNTGGGGGSGGGYSELLGDGVATSFVVNHNLGSRDVVVEVYRNSGIYDKVYPEILHTDDNNVTIDFTTTTPTTDEFAVFITSGGGGVSGGRTTLTANTTYYVATTGNDSNDGLTVGTPFLTLQKAIDTVASIDPLEFDVTIQLADGTYDTQTDVILKRTLAPTAVTIQGNSGDNTAVILDNSNVTSSTATLFASASTPYTIKDLTIGNSAANTAGGNYCLRVEKGSQIALEDCRWVASGDTRGANVIDNSVLDISSTTFEIVGGADMEFGFVITQSSVVSLNQTTFTLTSTPNFTTEFLFMLNGSIYTQTGAGFSLVGTATGIRYDARILSGIRTLNGLASDIPGDSGGTLSSGSVIGT